MGIRATRLTSVNFAWLSYRAEVVPKDAPAIQVQETRRAFYAGVSMVLDNLALISSDHVTEEAGAEHLALLNREVHQFLADVLKGIA